MDLFGVPSLPFGASLELDDQLFGDEFLHLLTSDLAMDCDAGMGLAPLDLDTSPATSSHLSDNTHPLGSCAPPSPASQPQSSCGDSERPILLPTMTVSRGPKAKTTIAPNSAAGLPSLVAGGIVRAWTVTTDVSLQSSAPTEQLPPAPVAWEAPAALPALTHKPSGDGSALQAPRTRRRGPAKPTVQASEDMDEDTDSEDSNDTQDEEVANCETKCGNKRKAPDVDWRSITDPVERRRQRRLAKNRVTAARSRERKKSQWAVMEAAQQKLEAENRALRDALNAATQDNQSLRAQLEAALGCGLGADATLPGTTAATGHSRGKSHTEPAVLVLIATLLTVCVLTLPSDQAAVVFGTAAAALLLLKRLQSTKSNSRSWSCGPGAAEAATVKIEQLLLEGQQQAATASARKKSGRARAGLRQPSQQEVVVKVEPNQGGGALGVEESGGLAQLLASAVCILGKVRKASCHGLPKRRAGSVPVGLFVS